MPGVLFKQAYIIRPHRLLQQMNGFGRIKMLLRAFSRAQLVHANAGKAPFHSGKCGGMMIAAVRFDGIQVRPAQRIGRVGEAGFHEFFVQAHGLEQLSALIGLQGGNAHLGSDFQYPGGQRPVVIADGFLRFLLHPAFFTKGPDAVMSQVGVHRSGTVGDQQGQLVHVPGFAALQDHGNRRALFDVDQVLLQRGYRQQRGNSKVIFVHTFIG